jgi:hypothetical protein
MRRFAILSWATLAAAVVSLMGCSEMQRPPMNPTQADAYNQCMSTHWSSLADTAVFGVAGYEYHQNAVLNCQQVALTTQAPLSLDQSVKPAALAVAPATAIPVADTAVPGLPPGASSPGNEGQPAR